MVGKVALEFIKSGDESRHFATQSETHIVKIAYVLLYTDITRAVNVYSRRIPAHSIAVVDDISPNEPMTCSTLLGI